MREVKIQYYETTEGQFPYRDWLESLDDKKVFAAILARENRLESGNFGDWKRVGPGVFELRVNFRSGYRIYFGRDGNKLVVLLCGGDKSSQTADIKRAIAYWDDYEKRKTAPARGR